VLRRCSHTRYGRSPAFDTHGMLHPHTRSRLLQAVTSALALAWSSYAASLAPAEPHALIELALKAMAMLEQCSKAAAEAAAKGTAPDTSANVGACLSGGAGGGPGLSSAVHPLCSCAPHTLALASPACSSTALLRRCRSTLCPAAHTVRTRCCCCPQAARCQPRQLP
jgi:hypothetical protein